MVYCIEELGEGPPRKRNEMNKRKRIAWISLGAIATATGKISRN
jgi:hypothetical protein